MSSFVTNKRQRTDLYPFQPDIAGYLFCYDVLYHIFSHLDPTQKKAVSLTCRTLRAMYEGHITALRLNFSAVPLEISSLKNSLGKFTALISLSFSLDPKTLNQVTDELIHEIAPLCKELRSLDLDRCTITDNGVEQLAPYCVNLTELDLSESNVTDSAIIKIAPYCIHLTSLELRDSKVTNASMKSVAKYCRKLTYLNVGGSRRITGPGIKKIAKNCPSLTVLILEFCNMTDQDIETMAPYCPKLTVLSICGSDDITNYAIALLATYCHQLKRLDITDCCQIDMDSAVQLLKTRLPDIQMIR